LSREGIKERINDFREILKMLLLLDITLLSGIVVNLYNVLLGKIPLFMIIISMIGLIVLFQLAMFTLAILKKLEILEKEL